MRKLLALVVTALAVTACAADQGATRTDASPPPSCGGSGTAFSTAKASRGAAGLVAPGTTLPVGDLLLTAGSTGELLVERGRDDSPGADGAPTTLRPGTLTVVEPVTGQEQLVRGKDALQPGTQTVFGDLDREHVVWLQETGTKLDEADWTIYAADRRTGEITRLAQAHPVDATGLKPTVPGYTIPRLQDGAVYWAEAAAAAGAPPTVGVYSRPVDGSGPTKLVVPNAILPVVSGQWLYYAAFDGADAAKPGYAISRLSLRTGETETVRASATGPGVASLAADGDVAAWALVDGTVEVSRSPSAPLVRITAADGEQLSWLSAEQGLVGFGDGSGQAGGAYLFDVRQGCLHDLIHDGEGSSVVIGGRTVAWTFEAGGRQRWQVSTRRAAG